MNDLAEKLIEILGTEIDKKLMVSLVKKCGELELRLDKPAKKERTESVLAPAFAFRPNP